MLEHDARNEVSDDLSNHDPGDPEKFFSLTQQTYDNFTKIQPNTIERREYNTINEV